jgi:hypothetical protein
MMGTQNSKVSNVHSYFSEAKAALTEQGFFEDPPRKTAPCPQIPAVTNFSCTNADNPEKISSLRRYGQSDTLVNTDCNLFDVLLTSSLLIVRFKRDSTLKSGIRL